MYSYKKIHRQFSATTGLFHVLRAGAQKLHRKTASLGRFSHLIRVLSVHCASSTYVYTVLSTVSVTASCSKLKRSLEFNN